MKPQRIGGRKRAPSRKGYGPISDLSRGSKSRRLTAWWGGPLSTARKLEAIDDFVAEPVAKPLYRAPERTPTVAHATAGSPAMTPRRVAKRAARSTTRKAAAALVVLAIVGLAYAAVTLLGPIAHTGPSSNLSAVLVTFSGVPAAGTNAPDFTAPATLSFTATWTDSGGASQASGVFVRLNVSLNGVVLKCSDVFGGSVTAQSDTPLTTRAPVDSAGVACTSNGSSIAYFQSAGSPSAAVSRAVAFAVTFTGLLGVTGFSGQAAR
jgi:hypothetical protein